MQLIPLCEQRCGPRVFILVAIVAPQALLTVEPLLPSRFPTGQRSVAGVRAHHPRAGTTASIRVGTFGVAIPLDGTTRWGRLISTETPIWLESTTITRVDPRSATMGSKL